MNWNKRICPQLFFGKNMRAKRKTENTYLGQNLENDYQCTQKQKRIKSSFEVHRIEGRKKFQFRI
jgi:hypothetical protein